MSDHEIGTRYLTSAGPGTCIALTPYQVQMRLDDGEDARWFMRANVSALPHTDDVEQEPSIDEMLDGIAALVEMIRAKQLAGNVVTKQQTSATSGAPRPPGEG